MFPVVLRFDEIDDRKADEGGIADDALRFEPVAVIVIELGNDLRARWHTSILSASAKDVSVGKEHGRNIGIKIK